MELLKGKAIEQNPEIEIENEIFETSAENCENNKTLARGISSHQRLRATRGGKRIWALQEIWPGSGLEAGIELERTSSTTCLS
jgi:hypothetical protein